MAFSLSKNISSSMPSVPVTCRKYTCIIPIFTRWFCNIFCFKLPAQPLSEIFVKYFMQWSHDLPVTPGLHRQCPAVSLVHSVPGIAPVVLQLHSED